MGRAGDGMNRCDMAGLASDWREEDVSHTGPMIATYPRIGVGAEWYGSPTTLRRGSVHQLIHIRFHTEAFC